jgi:hypothetical protein
VDVSLLREELHTAIDSILDKYSAQPPTPSDLGDLRIEAVASNGAWTYRWPKATERFRSRARYRVTGDFGEAEVLVARTKREAWGRKRGRVVVFAKVGPSSSTTYYPWTEFVETDDGDYAAVIPDSKSPRQILRDGDPRPPRLASATVVRADTVFRSIRSGPSLRVVVSEEDDEAMISHGYWVASLRGRI